MKKLYFSRHLLALLCFFGSFSGALFAQTMPEAQILPYKQKFEGLVDNPTTYPVGFQGWNATTPSSLGTPSNFTTTVTSDKALTANGTVSSTGGNIYNYNQKIGFLNGGSFLDQTIALAINTSNNSKVRVQYDIMVIRNPYVAGTTTNRINEMALQYRVGETGNFITLDGTSFQNNTTTRTSEAVAMQTKHFTVVLPTECDDKPVVQIRWITRQVSGSGARPAFAIGDIDVRSDNVAPISDAGYPKAANILSSGFDFINKINEEGKTYYVLVPGGSAEPTIAQIKAGQDATGNAALQSGVFDITDSTQEYSKSFTALDLNTTYSVFSISEDLYDNTQTVVSKVDAKTLSVASPEISTTITSLDLGILEFNYASKTLSYQVQASNLTSNMVLTASTNFTISKDNNTFASTLTFVPADFASNATPTVYVKFTPAAIGKLSGSVTHESNDAVTKTVDLTGIGINPYAQDFNDPNVLTNSGWTQYNVSGPVNKWAYSTVARNVNTGPGAVIMNGYSDTNVPSKDWLISPKLRLDSFNDSPLLSFYARKYFEGPSLKLMVSTDYDGVSSPETATWTELNGKFPTATNAFYQSQFIDLSAFKTDHTYVAVYYETTKGGNTFASEWSFDDFAITNETIFLDADPVMDFGVVSQNTVSDAQSFNFKARGYGDITITASAQYQVSDDNLTFGTSVLVTAANASAGKTLYVKFAPTAKQLKISGALTITGTSLSKQVGSLTGSSLPKSDTFDVVTYNMEFFGAPTTAYGPTNKALQMQNAVKVINKLDADVYVVQEISSDAAIDDLITQMNVNGKSFNKVVSTSWSYSWDPTSDPNYPPQKLVVIYDTKTTTLKNTRVMFKDFYDELRAGTKSLANYPGTNSNFFSSGRLPYMVTLETNLNGVKNEIKFVDLHARANSGTDISRYNMRKYDVQVLKDSLDTYYANSNIILLGDYNDDVKASVIPGQPSSYEAFVNDTNNYKALTLEISQAGAYSFLSSGGFLDHITISNELFDQYINESIAVYDPRNDITSYTTTTSDHGPVIARFNLKQDVLSTPDFGKNKYFVKAYPNPATDVLNFDIKTTQGRDLKIRLYDFNGRAIGNPISVKNESEVSTAVVAVGHLVPGVYFYTVTENNKVIFKDKVIKK